MLASFMSYILPPDLHLPLHHSAHTHTRTHTHTSIHSLPPSMAVSVMFDSPQPCLCPAELNRSHQAVTGVQMRSLGGHWSHLDVSLAGTQQLQPYCFHSCKPPPPPPPIHSPSHCLSIALWITTNHFKCPLPHISPHYIFTSMSDRAENWLCIQQWVIY